MYILFGVETDNVKISVLKFNYFLYCPDKLLDILCIVIIGYKYNCTLKHYYTNNHIYMIVFLKFFFLLF